MKHDQESTSCVGTAALCWEHADAAEAALGDGGA